MKRCIVLFTALMLCTNTAQADECAFQHQVKKDINAFSARLLFGVDKQEYAQGELINFCFSVKNFHGFTLRLTYPVLNKVRFQIWQGSNLIWRNVDMETPAVHDDTVPFLQSLILGQEQFTGTLAPGQYQLMGQTTAVAETLWLAITVKPTQPTNGPLQISPSQINFGQVTVDDTTSVLLQIANTICKTVWLDSIVLSKPQFVVDSIAVQIPPRCPGEYTEPLYLTIRFAPQCVGVDSGIVILHSHYIDNVFGDIRYFADTLYVTGEGVISTGVEAQHNEVPQNFYLAQNYPNPFNPATTIRFALPHASHVTLKIYDMTGREVATLVDDNISAGEHIAKWNAHGVPSGIFFYRLQTKEFTQTKKMTVLK